MTGHREVRGRIVLADRVTAGRVLIEDDRIAELDLDDKDRDIGAPLVAPGLVDVHVHGWGGHDAMGGRDALTGMARALARRGVTSFLPTAVSAPLTELAEFVGTVRAWTSSAPADGAAPLGLNLEGPFLSPARKGAHAEANLVDPVSVPDLELEPLIDGLRLITVAPELPGSLELIARLRTAGVAVSLGHSAATYDQASAGYRAGATGTTHLFNAMTGVDHRSPGLAVAALLEEDAFVELIADGHHVHPVLWSLIGRLKRPERLVLVSDSISMGGMGDGRTKLGSLDVEVIGGRATLAGTTALAGSVIALDEALRAMVAAGTPVPAAVAAASTNPLDLIGQADRGRIEVGQRADLVVLDDDLMVRGVWLAGKPLDA